MRRLNYIIISGIIMLGVLTSCDALLQDTELSEDEVVKGLKTALEYGADSSATELSQEDGYYGNELIKILLPEEAEQMLEYVEIIEQGSDIFTQVAPLVGINYEAPGEGFVETTIKSINRSAEDAAKDAKPIFVDAITGMTVEDGMNILQGKSEAYIKADFDSTAATQYLKYKTYTALVDVYSPKIDSSLNKVVVNFENKQSFTTNELWAKLIKYYNDAITICDMGVQLGLIGGDTQMGRLGAEQKIDTELSLGQFATGKALDGLFFRVGVEEKKIRKDPFAWASDILQKVFGYVYEETDGTTD